MMHFSIWPNLTRFYLHFKVFNFESMIGVSFWVVKWRINLWYTKKKYVSK